MNKSELFWQTYLNLEKELLEVAKYIYITDEKLVYSNGVLKKENYTKQLDVFSPLIADLIVRTCIEIEAVSKELYFELGGTKPRGDKDLFFDEDCLKLIDINCKSSKKIVMIACSFFNLTDTSNRVFKPLKEAHKRQGTDWERAYQAVKHDRYSSVSCGTIKNFIHALGALYLLNIYYKNQRLSLKYSELSKLDFSFGSNVFSLEKPSDEYVIDVINGKEISGFLQSKESPYILKYTDEKYREILEENLKSNKQRTDYILSQPEIKDTNFINNISKEGILLPELFKYRLNKKIPSNLSFEERKQMLIESDEYKQFIKTSNQYSDLSKITKNNIQNVIDRVGRYIGIRMEMQFQNKKINMGTNEGVCELVLDKGNVKYKK